MKQAQIDENGNFHCTLGVGESCTVTWQSNDQAELAMLGVLVGAVILVFALFCWALK
ncbi:MAG TPA: hypothetical protein VFU31_29785 [Candidatus Binatia bacterium]|nr:hypothetical protein [Candidatus Binatia bacterium]